MKKYISLHFFRRKNNAAVALGGSSAIYLKPKTHSML